MHAHLFDLIVFAATVLPGSSSSSPIVFLYFGPEVVFPLASFLAAAAGVILVFWRQIRSLIGKGFRFVARKKETPVEIRDDLDTELAITTASSGDTSPKGEGE